MGCGHSLLQEAEHEALTRGFRRAHLDTHDFQAMAFYLKEGYSIAGRRGHLPAGHTRYLLKRDFGKNGKK
jgi:hypothetical protein